jgi:steroid 5-alpha reductase family enzyme
MPVMVVNAVSPDVLASSPVRPWEIAGIAAVVIGYALEMTANWQKRRWFMEKMNKKHEQAFMTSGLFAKW